MYLGSGVWGLGSGVWSLEPTGWRMLLLVRLHINKQPLILRRYDFTTVLDPPSSTFFASLGLLQFHRSPWQPDGRVFNAVGTLTMAVQIWKHLPGRALMFLLNLFTAIALIFEGYNQGVLGSVSTTPGFIDTAGIGSNGVVTDSTKQGGLLAAYYFGAMWACFVGGTDKSLRHPFF